MESYFMTQEELEANTEKVGEVIFYKCRRASLDGQEMMRRNIRVKFAGCYY